MSLKIFHLCFIFISSILFGGMTLWGYQRFLDTDSSAYLGLSAISIICGTALVIYGAKFYKNYLK